MPAENFKREDVAFLEEKRNLYFGIYGAKGVGSINIRDAFFYGRTENFQLHSSIDNYKNVFKGYMAQVPELKYNDVTSLYPDRMVKGFYQFGHPKVLDGPFKDLEYYNDKINDYFGFVKCEVSAPKDLLISCLSMKINKKLMFPLCYTCAIQLNQGECEHRRNYNEFVLKGTWTTIELKRAVEKGLKLKTELGGYLKTLKTDEERAEWINKFKLREDVDLDPEKLNTPNPGLRFIAKLMLNSLWGILAQRNNLPQTEVITTYDKWWKLINDDKIAVTGNICVNDETMLVSWNYKDDCDSRQGNTNIGIAAMVTAYARDFLYDMIDKLEQAQPGCVLYCDTDSIIYEKWPKMQYTPPIGNFLGDMTDEITGDFGKDSKMVKFVCCGPKIMAMKYNCQMVQRNL